MSPPTSNYVKERAENLVVFGRLLSFKKINTRYFTVSFQVLEDLISICVAKGRLK